MPLRKSRFHDEKGHFADSSALRNAPRALFTAVCRRALGTYPELPWISYNAISVIESLARPTWAVLEFGGGMSTLWWARRVRKLVSMESDARWGAHVERLLAAAALVNVDLRLRASPDEYARLEPGEMAAFDFVMVDGLVRDRCMEAALVAVRAGGYVYLDNSDKHSRAEGGETRIAEKLLLDAASQRGGIVRRFVDFAPAQFFVNEGMLVKLDAGRAGQ